MLLLFLAFWPPFAHGAAGAWVVRLRGDVRILKGKQTRRLTGETRVAKGDVILAGRDARFTLSAPGVRFEAAPETAVEQGSAAPRLLYGHLRAVNPDVAVRLELPTATVTAPRGSEFVAHVARNRAEFDRRLSGLVEPAPPPAALRLGSKSPSLHIQVTCVAGSIDLRPKHSGRLVLNPGDLARVQGAVGDFAPLNAGVDEARRVRQVLGFQDN